MELQFLGTGAGQPSKKRNVACTALKLLDELNEVWLFDVGEATQHQILKTGIRPRKINRIFITHNHGDHIFGLPGLLSSRSFQGGDTPVTVYAPAQLDQFVKTALRVSRTKLAYPIKFVSLIDGGKVFENDHFTVYAEKLDHRVPSYGYRIVEKARPGQLLMSKLAPYHLPNGPIFGKLKAGKKVELADGTILNGKDFIGHKIPGRVITIIGDTRSTPAIAHLAENADVLVHEATFSGDESKLAHDYYHSTSVEAAQVAQKCHVGQLYLTHVSARYTGQNAYNLEKEARQVFASTKVVQDLDVFAVPVKG